MFLKGVKRKKPTMMKNWAMPTPILSDPAENIMKNGYIIRGIKSGRARIIASKKLGIICSILRSEPRRVEPHPAILLIITRNTIINGATKRAKRERRPLSLTDVFTRFPE